MLSQRYAVSLSTQQLVAILIIALLTFVNTRGLELGKLIQNVFTSAKTLSLMALIALGIFVGRNADALHANFTNFWTPTGVSPVTSDLPFVGAAAPRSANSSSSISAFPRTLRSTDRRARHTSHRDRRAPPPAGGGSCFRACDQTMLSPASTRGRNCAVRRARWNAASPNES